MPYDVEDVLMFSGEEYHRPWKWEDWGWDPSALTASRDVTSKASPQDEPKSSALDAPQEAVNYELKKCQAVSKECACQIVGCHSNLSELKEYYRRYRICPHHMGLHSIVLNGSTSRFCQQCGRFQPVEDFDDDKKTCRRKLEMHNARRRKRPVRRSRGVTKAARPPPWRSPDLKDAVPSPAPSRDASPGGTHPPTPSHGSALPRASPAPFSRSPLSSAAASAATAADYGPPRGLPSPSRSGSHSAQGGLRASGEPAPVSGGRARAGEEPAPASHGSGTLTTSSACFSASSVLAASSSASASPRVVPDAWDAWDGRAVPFSVLHGLSGVGSPPMPAPPAPVLAPPDAAANGAFASLDDLDEDEAFDAILTRMFGPKATPPAWGHGPGSQPHTPEAWAQVRQAGSPFMGLEAEAWGSSASPPWQAGTAPTNAGAAGAGVAGVAVLPSMHPAPSGEGWTPNPHPPIQHPSAATFQPPPHHAPQPPTHLSWDLGPLAALPPASPPLPPPRHVRVSLKLYGVTPEVLPPQLHDELSRLLVLDPFALEGSLRPGCVLLSLDAALGPASPPLPGPRHARAWAERLLARPALAFLRALPAAVLQLPDAAVLLQRGRPRCVVDLRRCRGVRPCLASRAPLAALAGGAGAGRVDLELEGRSGRRGALRLLARRRGRYLPLEINSLRHRRCARGARWSARAALPAPRGEGLVELEAAAGALLAPPRALLLLRCPRAVAEVCSLGAHLRCGRRRARALFKLRCCGLPDADALLRCLADARRAAELADGGAPGLARAAERLRRAAAAAALFCVLAGWPAALRLALPALEAAGGGGRVAAQEGAEFLEALVPDAAGGILGLARALGWERRGVGPELRAWAARSGAAWAGAAEAGGGGAPARAAAAEVAEEPVAASSVEAVALGKGERALKEERESGLESYSSEPLATALKAPPRPAAAEGPGAWGGGRRRGGGSRGGEALERWGPEQVLRETHVALDETSQCVVEALLEQYALLEG